MTENKINSILSTITSEQWEAIAAYASSIAKESTMTMREAKSEDDNLEQRVSQLLHDIGCPAHIKGYRYLRQAVIMVHNDYEYISAMTKSLYPELADIFKTTSSRVERAIRHAIECTFDRGEINFLSQVFSWHINKQKPTNSEAIAALVEYIKNS